MLYTIVLTATVECACDIREPHITIGDKYRLEDYKSDHVFTVGLVAAGDCLVQPRVRVYSSFGDKIIGPFKSQNVDFKIMDETLPGKPEVPYTKTAFFYKLTEIDLFDAYSWSIILDGQVVEGPISIPKRILQEKSSLKMLIVADMDLSPTSAPTINQINKMNPEDYDFFLHAGDFAYDIDNAGGKVGDDFFQEMSKTTKRIPYLITPGNHEDYAGGHLFNYRFRMPNTDDNNKIRANHFYDMVIKGTYFMFVDFDYIIKLFTGSATAELLNWMQSRFDMLDKRDDIIWRVFSSHRPFSCTDWHADDCSVNMFYLRVFEDMLLKHHFQFLIQGHVHIYLRSRPLAGLTVMPPNMIGSGAMVSIITGHSGTNHYFAGVSDMRDFESPIIEAIDSSGPTYVKLEITKKLFQSTLVLADNNQVRDTLIVERKNLLIKNSHKTLIITIILLIIMAIACTIAALLVIRCRHRDTATDIESMTHEVDSVMVGMVSYKHDDFRRVEMINP